MKTVKFYLAAALIAATVMTSCSNDDEAVNSNERVEVKFSSTQASVDTRVTNDKWNGGEEIGIYMLKGNYALTSVNISEGAGNIKYENKANTDETEASFSQTGNIIYYPANQGGNEVKVKFIAYYPYGTVLDGTTTFTRAIDVSNQNDQSAIDFLYAPAATEYDKTSGAVALPFVHKLVKLEFTISNGAGVTEPLANGMTVTIDNQAATGTLDLTSGAVTTSNSGKTITALTATGGATAEAIVFPVANNSSVKLMFKNDAGEEFTATVPNAADGWAGGKKYTYTVTLKKNATTITGTIADWGQGNGTGEGIEAE
ncbi:MAG: fimbrillin family protein [Bacteroidales bacterium]|jgi:hypothetical protein|nr:fimbrillin family protein [Bacteroidales bacterium]